METKNGRKMMKVLCPVAAKEGNKTFWMRTGVAYENQDGSINLYLDLLPTNGKLQLREYDEREKRENGRSPLGGFRGDEPAQASADVPF